MSEFQQYRVTRPFQLNVSVSATERPVTLTMSPGDTAEYDGGLMVRVAGVQGEARVFRQVIGVWVEPIGDAPAPAPQKSTSYEPPPLRSSKPVVQDGGQVVGKARVASGSDGVGAVTTSGTEAGTRGLEAHAEVREVSQATKNAGERLRKASGGRLDPVPVMRDTTREVGEVRTRVETQSPSMEKTATIESKSSQVLHSNTDVKTSVPADSGSVDSKSIARTSRNADGEARVVGKGRRMELSDKPMTKDGITTRLKVGAADDGVMEAKATVGSVGESTTEGTNLSDRSERFKQAELEAARKRREREREIAENAKESAQQEDTPVEVADNSVDPWEFDPETILLGGNPWSKAYYKLKLEYIKTAPLEVVQALMARRSTKQIQEALKARLKELAG